MSASGYLEARGDDIPIGGFPKSGVAFWGPNNKDYSILVSILGSPYFGKLPIIFVDITC